MKFVIIWFLILVINPLFSSQIFVATDGDDSNPGTIDEPFESIQKAQSLASPGDTVYIRGGLYNVREDQISSVQQNLFACISYLDKSGLPGKTIKYWAYPGETPVFDFSAVKPVGQRVVGIWMAGEYIHLKGFEMTGIQVTITAHTESYCIYSRGNNNIFEQISMHDNVGTGLRHYKGGGNLFLNCDSYRNWDNVSEGGTGGNTDGFGCHPDPGGSGNVFKGCRAWFNSDDGFDIIRSDEAVVFDSCWAFYNGFSTSFASLGDGNGFKAGGYAHDTADKIPDPVPRNTIRFCIAVRNKANGFYANHHLGGNDWYNNTGYRNAVKDFNMLNRPSAEDADNIDGPGYGHVLKNNLAAAQFGDGTANIDNSLNTQEANSWTLGITTVSDDFLSIDMNQLAAPRKADGSLPDIDFLRPAAESDVINAGVDIGFSFLGAAPDLGAFEFDPATNIKKNNQIVPKKINLEQNYPNPFNPKTAIRYTLSEPGSVTLAVYNFLGQRVRLLEQQQKPAGEFVVSWDGENDNGTVLASGIYFYRLAVHNASSPQILQKKMIFLK
jgi:Pel9A-like, right handed beta helix region/FlgD Ig-like domain